MTQAFPLQWPKGWTRTPHMRRRTGQNFKVTFDACRRDMYRELELLGAKSVVLSSNLLLRIDGSPRADAARQQIDDPGVAVYFELRERRMVMARDEFSTVLANMRSIGLAVEHLRGLDRHGGAAMMERAFTGFVELTSPDKIDAFVTLGINAGATLQDIEDAYRAKARRAHPDNGGSHDAMSKLNAARDAAKQSVAARNG